MSEHATPLVRPVTNHRRGNAAAVVTLCVCLHILPIRRAIGEDRFDFKYMYYQEEDDRIQVQSPSVILEKDISSTLHLKVEGIYNAISGASPTGAPATGGTEGAAVAATESYTVYVTEARVNEEEGRYEEDDDRDDDREDDDDDDHEREDRRGERRLDGAVRSYPVARKNISQFQAGAGATPAPQQRPQPSQPVTRQVTRTTTVPATSAPAPVATSRAKAPRADVEDERTGFLLEVSKALEGHTVTAGAAYSTEQDYNSISVSLRDAIDFNQKNTTLTVGGAYTHDEVDAFTRNTTESKDSVDLLLGLTQVIDKNTLFTVNLTLGQVEGYLDDQYKVVELNGVLVPERRPDSKDKVIVYTSITRFFQSLKGSLELGYRYYDDSFGIRADTYSAQWYQKLGRHFVLSPLLRWYQQSEADFYGVRFTGSPDFYSADYRISALEGTSYGLKLIFTPNARASFDIAYERYEQEGTDGVTPDDVYPSANIIYAGARFWF